MQCKSKLLGKILLIVIVVGFWQSFAVAEDNQDIGYEAKVMHAFLLDCIPPLVGHDDVARFAHTQNLPELARAAEQKFLSGAEGSVFYLTNVGTGAVLVAYHGPVCSILVQQLDQIKLVAQMNKWIAAANTPFKLTENNTAENGDIERKYVGQIGGVPLVLIISARTAATKGGLQAILTAGRTGPDE